MEGKDRLAELKMWRERLVEAAERIGEIGELFGVGGVPATKLDMLWQTELESRNVVSTSILLPASLRNYYEIVAREDFSSVSQKIREALYIDVASSISPNSEAVQRYDEALIDIMQWNPAPPEASEEMTAEMEEAFELYHQVSELSRDIVTENEVDMTKLTLYMERQYELNKILTKLLNEALDEGTAFAAPSLNTESGTENKASKEYEDEIDEGTMSTEPLAPMIREIIRQMKEAGEL